MCKYEMKSLFMQCMTTYQMLEKRTVGMDCDFLNFLLSVPQSEIKNCFFLSVTCKNNWSVKNYIRYNKGKSLH